jgi:hypothetical protein
LAAAKELKLANVPVREVHVDGLEAERFLIESNRQRVKTKAQRLREYKRLKEIEEKFADERKKESLKRGTERPVRAKLPTREELGRARDKAAAIAGLKPRTAEKGLAVLNKADSGDPKAQELMDSIDRDEISIDRAYKQVTRIDKEPSENSHAAGALAALDEADEAVNKFCRAISRYVKNKESIVDVEYAGHLIAGIKNKVKESMAGFLPRYSSAVLQASFARIDPRANW